MEAKGEERKIMATSASRPYRSVRMAAQPAAGNTFITRSLSIGVPEETEGNRHAWGERAVNLRSGRTGHVSASS